MEKKPTVINRLDCVNDNAARCCEHQAANRQADASGFDNQKYSTASRSRQSRGILEHHRRSDKRALMCARCACNRADFVV
jgi:hypothetical protein